MWAVGWFTSIFLCWRRSCTNTLCFFFDASMRAVSSALLTSLTKIIGFFKRSLTTSILFMILFEHVGEGQKSWKEGPKSRYKMHKSNKKYEHLNNEMSFFQRNICFWVRNQAFLDVSLGIWIIWVQIRYSFEIRYSSIKKRQRAHLLVQGWGRQSTQVYFFSGIILIAMSIVYSGGYNSFAKFHTHENGNSLWVPA